jgi:hypothetical protein
MTHPNVVEAVARALRLHRATYMAWQGTPKPDPATFILSLQDLEEARAAIAALESLSLIKGEGGWRPIEEAPKDGTSVLVLGGYSGKECFVSWWGDLNAADSEYGTVEHEPNWQWCIWDGKNEPHHLRVAYTLTHWQPLPPPPSEVGR